MYQDYLKPVMKKLIGNGISVDLAEKLYEYSILQREQSISLLQSEQIKVPGSSWVDVADGGRRELWRKTLLKINASDLLFLEFGVFKGESLREFVALNKSDESMFFGFDSFEGLPEVWRGTSRERFSVNGKIPDIEDHRVKFVKGWFRETLPRMADDLSKLAQGRVLVVHFDADLYSSTLYLLFTLCQKFSGFYFIFDEFAGHEARALLNFMQATGARAEFFYHVLYQGMPTAVSGRLTTIDKVE